MYFAFHNITSIRGFTSILIIVFAKTIMLWLLPTAPKKTPVHIIRFIPTTLKNEQHPCKYVRVNEYGNLEN